MKMIYDYARKRAGIYPDKIAISLKNEHVSYWQLEKQSNQLAELLIEKGLKPGERVGLLLEKMPRTIIAMHGISKAGGIYVPLDIHSPAERVSKILNSADPSLLLVDLPAEGLYQGLQAEKVTTGIPAVWWDMEYPQETSSEDYLFRQDEILNQPVYPHAVVRDPESVAHILFTSGSTGTPKGVMITHNNITSFVDWGNEFFEMNEDDRVSCHSPLHFDLSTFDIYGALAVGARAFLVPPDMTVHPQKLVDFIKDNDLTQWFSVPSALSYLANFDVIPKNGFPSLKRLIWCGEVFPVQSLRYWMDKLPEVQFTNLYGPTEATIASSYYTMTHIPGPDEDVPIGKACEGEKLWVLNEKMEQANVEEVGDLYISGVGLSPGYWRNEEKTRAAFSEWKDHEGKEIRLYKTGDLASLGKDLNYYFHGRSDYQIKSRGYRIELGEIEQALDDLNMLQEFAVVPVEKKGFEGTAIGCAFVSPEEGDPVKPIEIKQGLKDKVPSYMIPHVWKSYDLLPRNGNGKIDRKNLSDEFEGRNKANNINKTNQLTKKGT